jgi:hypothetical protein
MYLDNVSATYFSAGVYANNEAVVRMTRTALSRNEFGVNDFSIVSPGAVYSFGDNDIAGNSGDVNGALTSVSPK